MSQDRGGWDWQPIASTTAWNFQYGVLNPKPSALSPEPVSPNSLRISDPLHASP